MNGEHSQHFRGFTRLVAPATLCLAPIEAFARGRGGDPTVFLGVLAIGIVAGVVYLFRRSLANWARTVAGLTIVATLSIAAAQILAALGVISDAAIPIAALIFVAAIIWWVVRHPRKL